MIIKLESVDIIKSIEIFGDFVADKEENFITKGNNILK